MPVPFTEEPCLTMFFVFSAIPALDEKKLLLSFWEECSGPGSVFHASVDRVMKQMHNCFAAAVQEKHPGGAAIGINHLL